MAGWRTSSHPPAAGSPPASSTRNRAASPSRTRARCGGTGLPAPRLRPGAKRIVGPVTSSMRPRAVSRRASTPGVGEPQHVGQILVWSGTGLQRRVRQHHAHPEPQRQRQGRGGKPPPRRPPTRRPSRGTNGPRHQRQQEQRHRHHQGGTQADRRQQQDRQQHPHRRAGHGCCVHGSGPRRTGSEGNRRDQAREEERHGTSQVAQRQIQQLNRLAGDSKKVQRQQAQYQEHGDRAHRHARGSPPQALLHAGYRLRRSCAGPRLPRGHQVEPRAAGREAQQGDADHHEGQGGATGSGRSSGPAALPGPAPPPTR